MRRTVVSACALELCDVAGVRKRLGERGRGVEVDEAAFELRRRPRGAVALRRKVVSRRQKGKRLLYLQDAHLEHARSRTQCSCRMYCCVVKADDNSAVGIL